VEQAQFNTSRGHSGSGDSEGTRNVQLVQQLVYNNCMKQQQRIIAVWAPPHYELDLTIILEDVEDTPEDIKMQQDVTEVDKQ
jgi:hypothetical protein